MEVTTAEREFRYNSVVLKDPNPAFTVEQVREFYAGIYPEIVSAAIEGPTNAGNKLVYSFARAVGTKGADRSCALRVLEQARAKIDKEISGGIVPDVINRRHEKLYEKLAAISYGHYQNADPLGPDATGLPMVA